MGWEGKTLGEICAQIKDPARNGDRSLATLVEHIGEDHLVGWAWAPGPGRQARARHAERGRRARCGVGADRGGLPQTISHNRRDGHAGLWDRDRAASARSCRLRSFLGRKRPLARGTCRTISRRSSAPRRRPRPRSAPRTSLRSTRPCSSSTENAGADLQEKHLGRAPGHPRAIFRRRRTLHPLSPRSWRPSRRRRFRSSISCSSPSATARWRCRKWSCPISTARTTRRGAARSPPTAAECNPPSTGSMRRPCATTGSRSAARSLRTTSPSWTRS